ncbi:Immunity protein Imm1 [Saccharopolyspora shandongensis]|uniref:Immunity protein Imm1 n=1 Tax=Saccharopolyspora shandongensis TaxID=418495 RepID=A0A1H3NIN1_9PSEU|nr:Imm1 family immunity protein [Saccharopolyspora shandongensis]SDY88678.1 Immunity protein Imm1 [Saccharopolyspora shandongensis]
MSIRAGWAVVGLDGSYQGLNATLGTPEDVAGFVEQLSDPQADSARLVHNGRPLWDAETNFPDHGVFAAVVDGFGYLSYQDATRDKAYPEGDPTSEGCEFDDDDFPPGSGLPVEKFTKTLVEFLHTADRPASVTWRDLYPETPAE